MTTGISQMQERRIKVLPQRQIKRLGKIQEHAWLDVE
jgi:hypothetical protein